MWVFAVVFFVYCVGRDLYDELVTCWEESYRVCLNVVIILNNEAE